MGAEEKLTFVMQWAPGYITFYTLRGLHALSTLATSSASDIIHTLNYTNSQYVPTPGYAKVHVNLWLANSAVKTATGQNVSVLLNNFEFTPATQSVQFPTASCPPATSGAAAAAVSITKYPLYSTGYIPSTTTPFTPTGVVSGKVTGTACPQTWKVALYALGPNGTWTSKPGFNTFAPVAVDGSWSLSNVFTSAMDPLV